MVEHPLNLLLFEERLTERFKHVLGLLVKSTVGFCTDHDIPPFFLVRSR